MTSPYTEDAFQYRVDFAARVIAGGKHTTRSFDTCFEMWDGDAVAVALYRRARRNRKLRTNLFSYIDRRSVVKAAWANRRRPRSELPQWAAQLRKRD